MKIEATNQDALRSTHGYAGRFMWFLLNANKNCHYKEKLVEDS